MAQKQSLESAKRSSPSKRICPTVHGVVVGLSHLKDNRAGTLKWFDGEKADDDSVVHFVWFHSKLWNVMDKSHEEKSAVVMKNCSIQQSRRTLNFEIIANNRTKVDSSPRKFQVEGGVDHAMIRVLSISEACKLSPKSLVSMMVKIKTVNPPEELLRSDKQSHVTK